MKLGTILVNQKLVTQEQVEEAIGLQAESGKRFGQIMVEKGWIDEKALLSVLSEQFGLPHIWLRPGIYDPEAVKLISKETAVRLELLPLFKVRDVLVVATASPQAIPSFDELEERTGLKVKTVLAQHKEILKNIEEAFAGLGNFSEFIGGDLDEHFDVVETVQFGDFTAIDTMAEGSPVINLVNSIIQRAVHDGASDIHIEPSRTKCRIRFRIDGILYEVMSHKLEMHAAAVSRLKVIAGLDIAERRMPQDGRIQVSTHGRIVDLRFSSLPGIYGEKVVLRVLDKNRSILDIEKLGMSKENLATFKSLLKTSNGLLLVTGPTGSGKSTTLYAAITRLNSLEKNIVTIEDPVEYQLDIVNQNQIRENIGLGFAKMLKHILRQDPDIIMVGEIREHDTAEIAVQAALTGHLVLSTLHTNDAISAVTRLMDMGIEPYLLSSALQGVIGQRLVRTVCPECKTSFVPTKEIALVLGSDDPRSLRLSKGRGCRTCYDSGYKGRIGVHEIIRVDSELQQMMNANATREDFDRYIAKKGLKMLLDDGYDRVRRGLTTIEEVQFSVSVS
jgi:type IV pilus assembly protein PilB